LQEEANLVASQMLKRLIKPEMEARLDYQEKNVIAATLLLPNTSESVNSMLVMEGVMKVQPTVPSGVEDLYRELKVFEGIARKDRVSLWLIISGIFGDMAMPLVKMKRLNLVTDQENKAMMDASVK
jgi:hypothetical protein